MLQIKPQLSFVERADLVIRLLSSPPLLLLSFAFGLPKALARKIPLPLWAKSVIFGFSLSRLAPRHIQTLTPISLETYTAWIQKRQLERHVVSLPAEASLMWMTDPLKATKFVLFFHGGGYMAPLSPGHLNWCWNAYVKDGEGMAGHKVAVAILQYSLSPGAKYPTQLRQAVAGLNHILHNGIDPSDLIIGGDSAGGNLSMQLVQHIRYPVADIEPVGLNKSRLAGVFLVSPWISGRTDTVSFRDNGGIDMLSDQIVIDSEAHVLGPRSEWEKLCRAHPALPLDGDLALLHGVQSVTKSLYITCGNEEVFRDDIYAFSEAVRLRNPYLELRTDIGAGEVHDALLLEGELGLAQDATTRMQQWALAQLQ